MDKQSFIEKFIQNESLCDMQIKWQIIKSLDSSLADSLRIFMREIADDNSDSFTLFYLDRVCDSSYNQDFQSSEQRFHKNESVEELLQWFNDSFKGKVTYARKWLCKRFEHLSFNEQCEVIKAFMARGTLNDIAFCCKYFVNEVFWNKDYLPQIEGTFIECINRNNGRKYVVAKIIANHSSVDYITKCIALIDNDTLDMYTRDTLHILLIAHPFQPSELLSKTELCPGEYAYILAKKNLSFSRHEAAIALYSTLVQTTNCIAPERTISPDRKSYGTKLSIVTWAIGKMGYIDILLDFGVKLTSIYEEFKHNPQNPVINLIPSEYRQEVERYKDFSW